MLLLVLDRQETFIFLIETNVGAPPENVIEGYRIGARTNDQLNVLITQAGIVTEYSARIVMPDNTENPVSSAEKSFSVKKFCRY